MHFEENQLYPSSIGISPLSTVHPPRFQPGSVRPSTWFYPRFSLTMDRSLGFGSTPCDYINALFRLAFATAPGVTPLTLPHRSNSSAHSTKGTQSHIPASRHSALTVCKHMVSGTLSLPFWGTFHHSLTVLSAIGHREYLVLPNGLGRFPRDSACPVVLGKSARRPSAFRLRGCHPLWPTFPGSLG